MPKNTDSSFDFDNLEVLQDVELEDSVAFSKGKIEVDEPEIPDSSGEAEEADQPLVKNKPVNSGAKIPNNVELSDDLIIAGLKKASGNDADDLENDEENEDSGKPANKSKVSGKSYDNAFGAHYQLMVESGAWEPIEGFDGSREKYDEALEYNNQRNLDKYLDDYLSDAFTNNPEGKSVGMRLIKHLANGGSVSAFVDLYKSAELDFDSLDSEDDDVAERAGEEVLRRYYTEQGWEESDISDKIRKLKRLGDVVDEAKLVEKPYKKLIEKRQADNQRALEQQVNDNKAQAKVLSTGINNLLKSGHSFGNLKTVSSNKDLLEMQNYIFQPDEKTGLTGFRSELASNLSDPEFIVFLAAAMKQQLHKNPALLGGDSKAAAQQVKDDFENKLNKALLNKNLDSKGIHTGADNDRTGGSSRAKIKFNLDDAVVIDG